MTKLKSLKTRLEKLPETKKLKGLVGNMLQYQKKLVEAAGTFDVADRNEHQSNAVFGAGQVAVVAPERKKAARISKKLAARLREDIESVSNPRARMNDAVSDLSDIANKSERDVTSQWQKLIDLKVKPYDRLVDVARKLGLEGAEELATVMNQLKATRDTVPGTIERANSVAKYVNNLPVAVQKLGLNDPDVKQFVEDAAAGLAKLKSFSDNPSVSEFIQKHKLWALFRVGIS